jgi:hypothetical protein
VPKHYGERKRENPLGAWEFLKGNSPIFNQLPVQYSVLKIPANLAVVIMGRAGYACVSKT